MPGRATDRTVRSMPALLRLALQQVRRARAGVDKKFRPDRNETGIGTAFIIEVSKHYETIPGGSGDGGARVSGT